MSIGITNTIFITGGILLLSTIVCHYLLRKGDWRDKGNGNVHTILSLLAIIVTAVLLLTKKTPAETGLVILGSTSFMLVVVAWTTTLRVGIVCSVAMELILTVISINFRSWAVFISINILAIYLILYPAISLQIERKKAGLPR